MCTSNFEIIAIAVLYPSTVVVRKFIKKNYKKKNVSLK